MLVFVLLSFFMSLGFVCISQEMEADSLSVKKIIDHTAYTEWKQIKKEQISPSGKYITYEIAPLKGDTYLYYYNTQSNELDSIKRAKNAVFSYDERVLVYTVEAGYDTLRKAELAKIDKKKWPKDSLAVLMLNPVDSTQKITKIPNVNQHELGKEHPWLSYLQNDNVLKEKAKKQRKKLLFKKNKQHVKEKSNGKVLHLWNLTNQQRYVFKNVVKYEVSEKGKQLVYVQHLNDSCSVSLLDLSADKTTKIEQKFSDIQHPTFDKKAYKLVFLASLDTTKTKIYNLYLYDLKQDYLSCLLDTTTPILAPTYSISHHKKPLFSEHVDRLYFGVFDRLEPEKKDTLTDAEKPKLDIWHYQEPILQSRQIKELKKTQKKAYWYAYDFHTGECIGLENDTLSLQSNWEKGEQFVLAENSRPYELSTDWNLSAGKDYYLTDLHAGTHKLILKGLGSSGKLTKSGDKFAYFNEANEQYYLYNLSQGYEFCLTCDAEERIWTVEKNGMPKFTAPLGNLGWNKDGTELFLAEKNDFFMYHFPSNTLTNLTENIGKKNDILFSVHKWDKDTTDAWLDNFYLIGLDQKTKGTHFYTFENGQLKKQDYWDAKLSSLHKAKDTALYLLRKQSVSDYPDVYFWKDSSIRQIQQISHANPQQSEYNWATVELFHWTDMQNQALEGLVYLPENFDSTLFYPLIVYYYELNSDGLHNHSYPRPTASVIHPIEYASAGYIVFIPDIRYQVGYPAQGAYNCVMSGTDAILRKYPQIDSTRMGLQGQSWGGYQTAQLITMTDRYTCAMAGAPVSNMFSAFGGIRWSSGRSRQFQYEQTQSRIGYTIWEAPERYVENSPIFHLPKVNTPLLIMHNDQDGAVPWQQGIELFMGLRRLGKPCWLLNYNEDAHNLTKMANRMDLSIRMRQFFDHYLQNKPAPKWLTEGIPAVQKGKILGYE